MFDEKEWKKQYYINNKKIYRRSHHKYYIDNRETILKRNKKYWKDNKIKILKYREMRREKILKYRRKYEKNKYENDQKYNLYSKMSTSIRLSLKGNKSGRAWESLVDYNVYELEKHLKATMPKGYTWQDYFEGKLHIDHKIPKSVFNFTKPEHIDFKNCWALKNLRLLSAKENRMKGNKITKPFQPSLKIQKY